MKKILIFSVLWVFSSPLYAQFALPDFTAYQRLLELKNLVDKAKAQILQLKNGNKIANRTQANTQSLLNLNKEIEEVLRDVSEFENIISRDGKFKFNDISQFLESNKVLSFTTANYSKNLVVLKKLDGIINASTQNGVSGTSGQEMYDFFFEGTSAEKSVKNHDDFAKSKKDEIARVYELENTMQKKKFQTAMSYYKIADELYHQAIILSSAASDATMGKPMRIGNSSPFSLDNVFNTDDGLDLGSLFSGDISGGMYNGIMSAIYMGMPEEQLQREIMGLKGFIRMLNEVEPTGYESMLKKANMDLEDAMNALQFKATQKANQSGSSYAGAGLNPSNPSGFSIGNTALRMNTSERIQAQATAIQLMNQATDYKKKGDDLMMEAVQKTPLQQEVEARYQATLFRNSLAKIKL